MALNIKDPEADRLARDLAARTGESLTEAVVKSLRERLKREVNRPNQGLAEELLEIGRRAAKLRRTNLTPEQLIDYDEWGLPR